LFNINNLYTVISKCEDSVVIKLADENHPVFKAHFPENPLLPGFCHIEILSEILSDEIEKVSLLKLRQKTMPKEEIAYNIISDKNKRKIKILNKLEKLIGTISYEYK